MHIEHIAIRSHDLTATRHFFEQVLGLRTGYRPKSLEHIPGYWLYTNDQPIVHLIGGQRPTAASSTHGIDHVGLRLADYPALLTRLNQHGVVYQVTEQPELNEYRVFFRVPGGPVLEAVFAIDDVQKNCHVI